MNKSIFRAYDVRGKYPSEIDEEAVFQIALALGKFFNLKTKKLKKSKICIVVARDTRLSSPSLYRELIKGLNQSGGKIKLIKAGLATTPMLYFLTNYYKADGGVMVTASHNSKGYNGLKVVKENSNSMSGFEVLKLIK